MPHNRKGIPSRYKSKHGIKIPRGHDDGWIQLPHGARVHPDEARKGVDTDAMSIQEESGFIIDNVTGKRGRALEPRVDYNERGIKVLAIETPDSVYTDEDVAFTHTHPYHESYKPGEMPVDDPYTHHALNPVERHRYRSDSLSNSDTYIAGFKPYRMVAGGPYFDTATIVEQRWKARLPETNDDVDAGLSHIVNLTEVTEKSVDKKIRDSVQKSAEKRGIKQQFPEPHFIEQKAEFAKARKLGAQYHRMHLVKDDDDIYVTRIRSVNAPREEPDYSVASVLPAQMQTKRRSKRSVDVAVTGISLTVPTIRMPKLRMVKR